MLKVLHHFSIVLFLIVIAAELQGRATKELIAVKKSPESTSLSESSLSY